MDKNAISSARSLTGYTPEQTSAARKLYETLRKTKKPDHRIFAAALAEAFMSGMETQEQISAHAQQTAQSLSG